jgi:OmpA-OmpF porin, OOP family
MSKKTLYLLGILATIIIGTVMYYKYCCCQSCCKIGPVKDNTVVSNNESKENLNIFNINGNSFNYSCQDNFRFNKDDFKNIQPVSDSINLGILQLKSFFDKNPNSKLMITGYALRSEKNTSAFPNLGIARANDVKNYFVSKGFDASRFETQGEIIDTWRIIENVVQGPVNFKIKEVGPTAKTEDWNALKEKINANPLILYFRSSKSEINLTSDERQQIADLTKYLDNVPNAKISCVGHTDGTGNRDKNIQLGQNRADFAKKYLSKNGISSDRIESTSRGPDEPIADNTSANGKAKNRRTVVTLK